MTKPTFTAEQFTATKWDTAEDKAAFANRLIRLIETDFKPTIFTGKFYRRLSMCFGFIANFNQRGFYETHFGDTERKVYFLKALIRDEASFYGRPHGDPAWTYSDVEYVIGASPWVREQLTIYSQRYVREQEVRERADLARLKAKYEDGLTTEQLLERRA
jgi:hypothetical protein